MHQSHRNNRSSIQALGFRNLFLATCLVVCWIQNPYTTVHATALDNTDFNHLSLENVNDFSYSTADQRQKRSTDSVQESTANTTTDLKYILLWTTNKMSPFYNYKEGQATFINNNCSEVNCYATANRTLFSDVSKFDAIAFNGRTMSLKDIPTKRSRHQKYIYFQLEPADYFPVCDKRYDGFFNWTSTYRLDSDIPHPYLIGKNIQGEVIAPQTNMQWPQNFPEVDDELTARLANKTKAAAWFVSRCKSRSHREQFVTNLRNALRPFRHNVDIYGRCGPLKCARNEKQRCNALLKRDYFFYLSLENSLNVDYVTEKLLTALEHDIVPIVLGGADYSRYLPPGSYIEAKNYNATSLAAYMDQLIKHPAMYKQFFRWKSEYTYSDGTKKENVCALCAALNDKEKFEIESVYNQFRKWWLPNYKKRC